jgi:ABC-type bacteriocin/lantibiotic exporter with double-glycine peptidase domain
MYIPNTTLKNFIDPECQMEPERIKEILKEACLNEILEQHNVLNEPIGDNAGNFSLGQRQRLLLARVYIQSPSVVILDEATSNLDAATEQQVLSNFMRHLNPSTILIVSAHHSPPIIKFNKEYKLSETGMVESEIVSGV